MTKDDIILIIFPFTVLPGNKLRPAVVLSSTEDDVTVGFITTQTQWQEPTDLMLLPNDSNRLKKTSLIRTSKIATLDKSLSKGRIGRLTASDSLSLNQKLKEVLQLD